MLEMLESTLMLLRARWHAAHHDDTGATAIEWAIFAVLAVTIGGLVALAITAAVNSRLPNIK
jgi:Flp pilus assembly protein TadG